jgi:uncharacterized damage-inducible protein DinB
MTEALLQEFDREASTTRRVLERVPQDKLTREEDARCVDANRRCRHDARLEDDHAEWHDDHRDAEGRAHPIACPEPHHRGQLSVYLRLFDVPVPPIYGLSADENPFAAALA